MQSQGISDYGQKLCMYMNQTYNDIRQVQRDMRDKQADNPPASSVKFGVGDHVLVRRMQRKHAPKDKTPAALEYAGDKALDLDDEGELVDVFEEIAGEPTDSNNTTTTNADGEAAVPGTSERLLPLVYDGIFRIVKMVGEHCAIVEDAVDPKRPLPWRPHFTNRETIADSYRRNLSQLIKIEVPDLPKDDTYIPQRVEICQDDGSYRRGIAKSVGVDGSVGIVWDDASAGSIDFVQLTRKCYRWIGPDRDPEDPIPDQE